MTQHPKIIHRLLELFSEHESQHMCDFMGVVILKNVPIGRVTELKERSLLQMVLLLASLQCLD